MSFLLRTLLLVLLSVSGWSQQPVFLQLEEINSLDLIRYYPGDKIKFSTKEYPDIWRKERIVRIDPLNNLIFLETGYISPEEIHSLDRKNTGAIALGVTFTTFAVGWFALGLRSTLLDPGFKMSAVDVIIGAVAAGIGWLFRKVFARKKYPMDKFYRLRIMDIRFPVPSDIQTP